MKELRRGRKMFDERGKGMDVKDKEGRRKD